MTRELLVSIDYFSGLNIARSTLSLQGVKKIHAQGPAEVGNG